MREIYLQLGYDIGVSCESGRVASPAVRPGNQLVIHRLRCLPPSTLLFLLLLLLFKIAVNCRQRKQLTTLTLSSVASLNHRPELADCNKYLPSTCIYWLDRDCQSVRLPKMLLVLTCFFLLFLGLSNFHKPVSLLTVCLNLVLVFPLSFSLPLPSVSLTFWGLSHECVIKQTNFH